MIVQVLVKQCITNKLNITRKISFTYNKNLFVRDKIFR